MKRDNEKLAKPEIGDRLGCSSAVVWRRLQEYGIETRPPACVPQTLVPEEVLRHWSPDLAYVVGMITTDGNLKRGINQVSFFSTDYQWIKTYLELLQIDAPVHETLPQKPGWKILYTVAFSDPDYRAFLEGVGLTPAKSTERTLGPLNVPDVFFRDFLRACIDGDGGVYAYWQRGYLTFRVSLTSACRPFLEWVGETVKQLIGLEIFGLYQRQLCGTWTLVYYGSRGQRLLEWLYYAPDLPCLERKRAVWERYLRARGEG